jgi:hypothetical protein
MVVHFMKALAKSFFWTIALLALWSCSGYLFPLGQGDIIWHPAQDLTKALMHKKLLTDSTGTYKLYSHIIGLLYMWAAVAAGLWMVRFVKARDRK